MHYIIGLNIFVYIIGLLDGMASVESKLALIPELVLKGEVWRLFTYIFIPPFTSVFWIVFTLYFYYMIGNSLEHEWGSFRFNLYYLIGILCTTIAAFVTGGPTTATYLNLSLVLAFAKVYPNYQILIYFVLPVKVKYLAWLDLALIAFTVLSPNPLAIKVAAVVSVANYFVFFGKDIITSIRSGRKAYHNHRTFNEKIPRDFTMHKCAVCGKTERDDRTLEFRYCTNCEGNHEYCMEHLETHQHIKGQQSE